MHPNILGEYRGRPAAVESVLVLDIEENDITIDEPADFGTIAQLAHRALQLLYLCGEPPEGERDILLAFFGYTHPE
ncbi:hypothetical protein [Streptomyces sp. NPDC019224]|uniref:hypothetical protein n=1 Tax=Streptomyces sp. NPDC019224 TaxID=3154484 RepID=UPI0033E3BC7A